MTAADFTTLQDTHTATKRGLRGEAVFFLVAALLLVIAVVNTLAFGLVGLAMTALALVPVCYFMLLWITVGK